MVDFEKLKVAIDESGMTMVAIANKTGILRATLYQRFRGVGEFKASEIEHLSEVLHLSNEDRNAIFFAKKVEIN